MISPPRVARGRVPIDGWWTVEGGGGRGMCVPGVHAWRGVHAWTQRGYTRGHRAADIEWLGTRWEGVSARARTIVDVIDVM